MARNSRSDRTISYCEPQAVGFWKLPPKAGQIFRAPRVFSITRLHIVSVYMKMSIDQPDPGGY